MTLRETAIAKLQQLPEPLLQQVSNFIDFLLDKQQHDIIIGHPEDELAEAWAQWFEAVDHLEVVLAEPARNYQEFLLSKYRQQGLEL